MCVCVCVYQRLKPWPGLGLIWRLVVWSGPGGVVWGQTQRRQWPTYWDLSENIDFRRGSEINRLTLELVSGGPLTRHPEGGRMTLASWGSCHIVMFHWQCETQERGGRPLCSPPGGCCGAQSLDSQTLLPILLKLVRLFRAVPTLNSKGREGLNPHLPSPFRESASVQT